MPAAVDVRGGRSAAIATAAILLTGCAGSAPAGSDRVETTPTSTTATARQPFAAAQVAVSVRRAIEAFNATAGGANQAQETELRQLLPAGQSAVQDKCPKATSTISFDPVYSRLTPAPDWRPRNGTLPGQVYALPTLIRIYTGDRITGTDLTDLHVSIDSGRAWLPALCLN